MAVAIAAAGWLHAASQPARPPTWIPASAETAIDRLPRGYSKLVPRPGQSLPAGGDALSQAEQLLAVAASTGDARLAARAKSLLVHSGAPETARLLRARAFSAQHEHDFPAALAYLDRAIALSPRDGDAWLARAQVHLVSGDLDKARSNCIALSLGVDAGRGAVCVTAVALRRGQYAQAAATSDRWLAQATADDGMRRFGLVQRAEVAGRAGDPAADRWFEAALAHAPHDVRTLSAYARHLRTSGRPRDVLALLADAPASDGLRLERALALRATGAPAAAGELARQARTYAMARAIGNEPELRDEAELLLALGQPGRALALAMRNFATQRDHEDVDLLVRAARAAGRPGTLGPARAWATAQGLALPTEGLAP